MRSHGKSESLAVADTLLYLADVLQNHGDSDGAEVAIRESLRIRRATAPHQAFQIAITLNVLANVLAVSGKKDALEPVLLECLAAFKKVTPAGSNVIAKISLGAGEFYLGNGQLDKAEGYLREALRIYSENKTNSVMYRDLALQLLSGVVKGRDDGSDNYLTVRAEFLSYVRKQLGADDPRLGRYLIGQADYLAGKDLPLDAIPLAIEALKLPESATLQKVNTRDKALTLLARAAGKVAIVPNRPAEEYQQAMLGIKAILAVRPDDVRGMTVRGLLLYRMGQFLPALKMFVRDGQPVLSESDFGRPVCLAVVAMSRHRLNRPKQAAAALDRLRTLMKKRKFSVQKDYRELHSEVETLLKASPGRATP